jgi:hypothetical protein
VCQSRKEETIMDWEDDAEKLGISWVGYAIEKHFGVG